MNETMLHKKHIAIGITLLIGLWAINYAVGLTQVQERKQEVMEATWLDNYGVPVPEGKRASECLDNPADCL